eukprot:16437189-Heterocapsa_arctica.AAC.1
MRYSAYRPGKCQLRSQPALERHAGLWVQGGVLGVNVPGRVSIVDLRNQLAVLEVFVMYLALPSASIAAYVHSVAR